MASPTAETSMARGFNRTSKRVRGALHGRQGGAWLACRILEDLPDQSDGLAQEGNTLAEVKRDRGVGACISYTAEMA